jgi:hypothetical protein
MDVTEFAEGKFVNIELVKNCKSPIAVIVSEAMGKDDKFGRLSCQVSIDKKIKTWTLTMAHVKSMKSAFGKDSSDWVEKKVLFSVQNNNGKDCLAVVPMDLRNEMDE